ncbi:hypothetical protein TZ00_15195 [Agreia bicolorata]|uniref:Uncharacterized protein n=1 Tax=Agreia bicolorata TaxID=110935 RepID=A0ABR5CD42_9MICO|nr:hypothetical protein TZ00_15195 [Agreia bicolorata]
MVTLIHVGMPSPAISVEIASTSAHNGIFSTANKSGFAVAMARSRRRCHPRPSGEELAVSPSNLIRRIEQYLRRPER